MQDLNALVTFLKEIQYPIQHAADSKNISINVKDAVKYACSIGYLSKESGKIAEKIFN